MRSSTARFARWCIGALAVAIAGCGDDSEVDKDSDAAPDVEVDDDADAIEESDDEVDAAIETRAEIDSAPAEVETEVVDGDAAEEVDTGPGTSGFPANGLVVRILDPGAMGTAEVIGDGILISGSLMGNATAMSWQAGGQSGVIEPLAFWRSGTIELEPGDNRITVTASDGSESVTDTIVVTYNPNFRFDEELSVRPRVLWVGTEAEVVFTMKASRFATADRETMRLLRVDADGDLLSDEGQMLDDGRVSTSGDEIQQDGLFTLNAPYTCLEAGPMYFRVSVKVGDAPSYTAVSRTVRVDCLERVTPASCTDHKSLIESAGLALEGGAALEDVRAQLADADGVAQVGLAEDGGRALWILFEDGLLGAVTAPEEGLRGTPSAGAARLAGAGATAATTVLLASKRALVLSPRASEFGEDDEGQPIAESISAVDCPRYELQEGRALTDSEAGIDRFRGAASFGIIAIASEGEVLFGGMEPALQRERWRHVGPQEVLWTGSPVSCDALQQTDKDCHVTAANPGGDCPIGTRCVVTKGLASDTVSTGQGICVDETQVDLRLGNAIITNKGYAITPSFFETWRGGGFPASLVQLGACRSLWNGSLASSLYAAGARAVIGFSGVVDSAWAGERGRALFERLTEADASVATVGDLFAAAEDPMHAGTFHRLFGASNLDLLAAGLLNGDFETGSLVGWRGTGDGRAVSQFGTLEPVSGKVMGLVSSGLGFSVETGTLEQTFCIPADKQELQVSWKFMSEEFKEWCGNAKFQDRFRAELIDAFGAVTKIVEVNVDDLCSYADGTCAACPAPKACDPECFAQDGCYFSQDAQICEGEFNCQCGRDFVGLSPASIPFDQGGVFEVMWRTTSIDVSGVAGQGPVTLRLSVEDLGDSLFDTAVLIDAIEVK